MPSKTKKPVYLWDYDLSESDFSSILNGQKVMGPLNSDWAAIRLLEYGTYQQIVGKIGFSRIVKEWQKWRKSVKSISRKRGLDFLVSWLPQHHPEWL